MKDLVHPRCSGECLELRGKRNHCTSPRGGHRQCRREEERGLGGVSLSEGVSLSHRHGHSRQTLPGALCQGGVSLRSALGMRSPVASRTRARRRRSLFSPLPRAACAASRGHGRLSPRQGGSAELMRGPRRRESAFPFDWFTLRPLVCVLFCCLFLSQDA